jgi:hypothetical protein
LASASSNTSVIGTQQEGRHQLFHCDVANADTKNMIQDANLKIVCTTGNSTNTKQHAVRWQCIQTMVNGRQLTRYHTAGVCRWICDQVIAARNGKPPCPTEGFIRTVRESKDHDIITSGIFLDEFHD